MRNNHTLYLRPILFIAFFIGIALSVLAEERDALSRGADISNIAIGMVGLGTFLISIVDAYAVYSYRKEAKTERTFKLIQDVQIKTFPEVDNFLRDATKSIEEKRSIVHKDLELTRKIVLHLNGFETIAIFYNTTKMLDTKFIKYTYSTIIMYNFSTAKWFIEHLRLTYNNPNLYIQWEILVTKLSKTYSN